MLIAVWQSSPNLPRRIDTNPPTDVPQIRSKTWHGSKAPPFFVGNSFIIPSIIKRDASPRIPPPSMTSICLGVPSTDLQHSSCKGIIWLTLVRHRVGVLEGRYEHMTRQKGFF